MCVVSTCNPQKHFVWFDFADGMKSTRRTYRSSTAVIWFHLRGFASARLTLDETSLKVSAFLPERKQHKLKEDVLVETSWYRANEPH